MLSSCSTGRYLNGEFSGSDLVVPLQAFRLNGHAENYRRYVIVQHASLQYPICVYRISAEEYSALWMRCSHQGAELQVFGEKLVCGAHGSEFGMKGEANSLPATEALKSFPVRIEGDYIKINLS